MLIRTKIAKIISKTKRDYKSFPVFLDGKIGKEQNNTEWLVDWKAENGNIYEVHIRDGRKTNSLYEGKEMWGEENTQWKPYHLDYWWWTKEKFEQVRQLKIKRAKEFIEFNKKEIIRLQSLN